MRRALTAVGCAAAAGLLAGLLLGWRLWSGRPVAPALVARIDTVLVQGPAVRDTLRVLTQGARAQLARGAAAVARADSAEARAARLGVTADSLLELVGDTAAALIARTAERDSLRETVVNLRAAHRGAVEAAALFSLGQVVAEGRINQLEATLGEARATLVRLRPQPRWAAGALWEPGSPVPVGGFVSREVGPFRVQLEASDGPQEPGTVRLGLALRR